jgi:hypothetical protein
VTVPTPAHCEVLELLEQHMLELPLELELLLLTHELDPTIRLAKDVSPKPDAICGRTVTNKTKLAAATTAMRARGFQLFTASPPLSPRRTAPQNILPIPSASPDDMPVGQGAAKYGPSGVNPTRAITAGR